MMNKGLGVGNGAKHAGLHRRESENKCYRLFQLPPFSKQYGSFKNRYE